MKKYLSLLFLLSSSLFAYPACSKDVEHAVHSIYHFPEGKALLEKVESEGPLQIYRAPFNSNSPAMWVPADRAIVLNTNSAHSYGEMIRSIFFELHNALTNSQFIHIDTLAQQHRISKADYVETVERLEHQNAYNTASAIARAIEHGYFPHDAWWPIPADFDTHFRVQKQSGHSAKIAATYDALSYNSYYGSSQ